MKVLVRDQDLSDDYIRFAAQIGADGFDIHNEKNIPGVASDGYADVDGVRALVDRLRRLGMGIYRVSPPTPTNYLLDQPGGQEEVDNLCRTLEALGRAGAPIMSMPVHLVHLGSNPGYRGFVQYTHRGGYRMHGFDRERMNRALQVNPPEWEVEVDAHWERCVRLYQRLIPIAEEFGVKLVLHPSDPQLPTAEWSPRRWSQILDEVPSANNGLLYCVGTRYETGADVLSDIRAFGRRRKIFHVHFRNVRGTIPASGGYEEVALHDGDMNMFQVLRTLKDAGFDGGIQVDHIPQYDGDTEFHGIGWAYAVGYVRALLVAME